MSRSRRKQFALGLGSEEMSLVDLATRRALTSLPLAAYVPGAAHAASADWEPSIASLVAQANLAGGADLQVTVADDWARYWMYAIPEGVSNVAELQALAGARFETLFGTSPDGWQLMADWKAAGSVLVCALPERLLAALQTQAVPKGWRVRSIQPSAIRLLSTWQRRIPDECWVACYGRHGLLLLRVSQGEIAHVRRHPFTEPCDEHRLGFLLEAEMLRLGLDAPAVLCVLGMAPAFAPDVRIAGMRLLQPQAGPGGALRLSESLALGLQGAAA